MNSKQAEGSRQVKCGHARRGKPLVLAAVTGASMGLVSQLSAATTNMPIAVTGWNQDVIAETTNATTSTTAPFSVSTNGLTSSPFVLVAGFNSSLPANNTSFVSGANSATTFQIPNYTQDNALVMSTKAATSGSISVATTGTLTLSNPAALSSMEFLTVNTDSVLSMNYTVTYTDNSTTTGVTNFLGFNSATANDALSVIGKASRTVTNLTSSSVADNVYASESDIAVPYIDKSVKSISFSVPTASNIFLVSVLGVSGSSVSTLQTWAGSTSNVWDTSAANWSGPTTYSNGQGVLFNDSAPSSADNVTIAPAGVTPVGVEFRNNSSSYTISGGGIGGTASLSMVGSGTTTLNNSNTYTGGTTVTSGSLIFGPSASVASPVISVASGGTLTIASGAQLTAASGVSLADSGTVNLNCSSATLATGTGTGTLNLNGTALTLGIPSNALQTISCTIKGTGSLIINGNITITGTNTFSGGTTLDAATFNGGTASYLRIGPGALGTGTITFNGGFLSGVSNTAFTVSNPYTFGPNASVNGTAGTGSTLSGPGYLPAGSDEFNMGSTLTLSGPLSGPGQLMVGPASNLVLNNAGSSFTGGVLVAGGNAYFNASSGYTGPTSIQAFVAGNGVGVGSITLNNPGGLGYTSGVTIGGPAGAGALFVNDNSGYAGLAGGVSSGAPITATLSDTLTAGALASFGGNILNPPVSSSTWAGNLAIASGGGSIGVGYASTFNLTGTISGAAADPVIFVDMELNYSLSYPVTSTVVLSHANTYAGETQLFSNVVNTGDRFVLQMGAVGAIPAASGISFLGGNCTVDLNGYAQQTAYLKGVGTITNSSGTPATLTLGGTNASGAFSGTITGNLSLTKTGSGTQSLGATSSYTGTTRIAAGTLAVGSSQGLGSGPVVLAGGTLALSTANGGLLSSMQTNGTAFISNNVLTLTNDQGINVNEAGSAFTPNPVSIPNTAAGFTARFVYNATTTTTAYGGTLGDGITFTIQNDPSGSTALGDPGDGLGYGAGISNGIQNSGAIELSLDPNSSTTPVGTNFTTNGAEAYCNDVSPLALGTEPLVVTITYDGSAKTLTETLVGQTSGGVYTTTYGGVDFSQIVGTTAYVGFTGGDGANGDSALQTISNFSFNNGTSALVAPLSLANTISTAPGTSSVVTAAASTGSSQLSLEAITITAGSKLAINNTGTVPLVLTIPGLSVSGSTNAWTGQLDLQSNDLIVTGAGSAGLAQITNQIKSGYSGGNWNGSGIMSSTAAADSTHLTALGVILNDLGGTSSGTALYTTFDGAATSDGDVLVKYTYYGDTNLDGVVDGSDYSRIDAAYLNNKNGASPQLTGWYNGDFNYDGLIDGSDYTLIDNAFNQQGTSLSAQMATATSQISGNSAAVPEPSTLTLLALGIAGLLGRRRR